MQKQSKTYQEEITKLKKLNALYRKKIQRLLHLKSNTRIEQSNKENLNNESKLLK